MQDAKFFILCRVCMQDAKFFILCRACMQDAKFFILLGFLLFFRDKELSRMQNYLCVSCVYAGC